ncbi:MULTISPECIES: permease [Clostridium]|uniref:Permease n=1 Tax=Clostridium botulinum TaxID=1491 RepID=A0A6B4RTH0_CLOBO|nr:permease [Clostridium botulinum]AJF29290.1 permease [Clostridium botulinum]AJF32351.1 permease [Clostridium botulinum]KIL09529.1 permease [Clostridium botulinum]MBN1035074.1 permease [Clostridium botulinum]MBN1041638.1 permease [Clostridium botulinum]
MKNKKNRNFLIIVFIIFLSVICIYKLDMYDKNIMEKFFSTFVDIMMDSTPFIVLGAIISGVMQIYISNETIRKCIPKNNIIGYFGAALIGLIFPICECAIIPITRALIKKGVPLGFAMTFMMAVPLINPIVIMSTYTAFNDNISMVIARTVGGFVGAILIGVIMTLLQGRRQYLLMDRLVDNKSYCNCGCNDNGIMKCDGNKFKLLLEHSVKEFLDIMKYLIIGAFLATAFQVLVPTSIFDNISNGKMLSIIFMMLLSFLLSLCSEVDAFIGKNLLNQYPFCGVVAFLIFGAMLDMKNLIMLFGTFRKEFVIKLSITIVSVVILVSSVFLLAGL